jgi:hypothetical protein
LKNSDPNTREKNSKKKPEKIEKKTEEKSEIFSDILDLDIENKKNSSISSYFFDGISMISEYMTNIRHEERLKDIHLSQKNVHQCKYL